MCTTTRELTYNVDLAPVRLKWRTGTHDNYRESNDIASHECHYKPDQVFADFRGGRNGETEEEEQYRNFYETSGPDTEDLRCHLHLFIRVRKPTWTRSEKQMTALTLRMET